MSERWKYQIKTGGSWGIFMNAFMILFEIKQVPFLEQVAKPEFYIRGILYILIGIFVLGYFTWKSKIKRENTK